MDFLTTIIEWLVSFTPLEAHLAIFLVLLACGLGLPIPEDITLFGAGYYVYHAAGDGANVWGMIVLCMAGVMIGDSIIFYLGSRYGMRLTQIWMFKRILTPQRIEAVRQQLLKRGNRLIFAGRFMPGLRAPIFFTSATLGLPYRTFLLYDGGAALISVPAIVYSVYYFGDKVDYIVGIIKNIEHGIVGVIVAIVIFYVAKWYIKNRKKRSSEVSSASQS